MTEFFDAWSVSFAKPERLMFAVSLILTIIMLIGILFWRNYNVSQKALGEPWFKMHISRSHIPSAGSFVRKFFAAAIAIMLLSVLQLEPEITEVKKKPVYGGITITFIQDSSLSMKYAEDLNPNRLVAAKQFIAGASAMLISDREIAGNYFLSLIPFAGASIPLYAPFITDRDEFSVLLETIDEKTVTTAGTSIPAALSGYRTLLKKYPVQDENTIHIALLISDGGKDEKHFQDMSLIEEIIKGLPRKTIVNTVGIGSKKVDESCLSRKRAQFQKPLTFNEEDTCSFIVRVDLIVRDESGNIKDYLRENPHDQNSPALRSELDEGILQDVARLGGGKYFFFSQKERALADLKKNILEHRVLIGHDREILRSPADFYFLLSAFLIIYFSFFTPGLVIFCIKKIFPKITKTARG